MEKLKTDVSIEFDGVSKIYPGKAGEDVVAVADFDLRVGRGETVCVIGTSGSGKTTVLKMVNRLLEPTHGSIRVEGEDVESLDVIRLRRGVGYVIQEGGLFPHMSIERNVGLICQLEGWSKKRTRERARELLDLVNLPPDDLAHRYPSELSGGQKQRVGVARALALDPEIILMDEPFGALDPITREQLHKEFLHLEEKVKKTVLLVTHDLAEAFKLGDRIALMDGGRLVQAGSEKELRESPASDFVTNFVGAHLGAGGEP